MGKFLFVRHAPPNLINSLLNRPAHSGEYRILNHQQPVVCDFLEILNGDFTNLLALQDACNFCALGFYRISPTSCREVNG